MRRIHKALANLYGTQADRLLSRFAMMIGRYGVNVDSRHPTSVGDQRACLLITYADTIQSPPEPPLAILRQFLETQVRNVMTHLHVLPFFPASS
ncbi:MAG: hypothetical protein KKF10_04975, partial [Verrucomicrobia bacterium]|nr:hypothetical protein [Verrucomicrobiota bacterium]